MTALVNQSKADCCQLLLRTGSPTKQTTHYVALFTTLPADDGTGGTEVSGTGYARVGYNPSDSNWSAISAGESHNLVKIQFGSPTANWGTVVGWGIYSASSGGTYLLGDTLTTSRTINSGDPAPYFNPGDLSITFG